MTADLTEDDAQRLIALRGGCSCAAAHAPCFACSEPITEEEAEMIGLPSSPAPASPLRLAAFEGVAR